MPSKSAELKREASRGAEELIVTTPDATEKRGKTAKKS